MKRLVLIVLLCMVPLQFAWAAAGAYCAHEEGRAAQHFGHHAHQHEGGAQAKADAAKLPAADADCDVCHHLFAGAIDSAPAAPGLPQRAPHLRVDIHPYVSHIPDLVPRPVRPRSA